MVVTKNLFIVDCEIFPLLDKRELKRGGVIKKIKKQEGKVIKKHALFSLNFF